MSQTTNEPPTQSISLACPRCGVALPDSDTLIQCAGCGATYPVKDGIPRLLETDFYWGEIEQSAARALIDTARRSGWKEAIAGRFSPGEDAWISILDWQRASWIPLLELDRDAKVLDVGSGYGAITHALAQHFDEVHSIDAIAERVQFTRIRLDQAGCDNVKLVVGSAVALPYPPGSFDAIVVNGVLEWIGDWDMQGSPREAQLRFLSKVHALLKPNGRLIIGIENRLTYTAFRGAIDHSGLPYTNLLPRPLATAALRVVARDHHRMVAPSRTYRTYTYTEKGYRELFGEAGFEDMDSYWAEPGYNQPYRLTPLDDAAVAASLTELQVNARPGPLTMFGSLKRAFARKGFFRHFVPDFVFIIRKQGRETQSWKELLPETLRRDPHFLLTTYKFAEKTTIRASAEGSAGAVVKCSTPTEESRARVSDEYAELESIWSIARKHPALIPFAVSRPLGSGTYGRQFISVETLAAGEPMQMELAPMKHDDQVAFLKRHLPRLAENARTISGLARYRSRRTSAAPWLAAAQTVVGASHVARANAIGDIYRDWMCHGDFTLENCIHDRDTNTLTLIDWEFVRDGVPPLYDLFSLYFSVLNYVIPPASVRERFPDDALARFYTLFFHRNEVSELLAPLTTLQYESLGILSANVWQLFEDSLLFRIGYLVERQSSVAASRIRFLNAMGEWRKDFQLQG